MDTNRTGWDSLLPIVDGFKFSGNISTDTSITEVKPWDNNCKWFK